MSTCNWNWNLYNVIESDWGVLFQGKMFRHVR